MNSLSAITRTISQHLAAVDTLASEFIEQEARKILRSHPVLDEFIMAMGGCCFTRKVGTKDHHGIRVLGGADQIISDGEGPRYIKDSVLMQFIDKYDRDLKLTGEAMRFTAEGAKVTHW